MSFLQIQDLVKSYDDTPVLRSVSLDVDQHEVVCLIGASGSGKSTLLRCINSLEEIDGGEVWLDDQLVSGEGTDVDQLRRDVGIVFQSFNLFPHMTVQQNITLAPRKIRGLADRVANDRAAELLQRVGLADKASTYPDQLSGGQQQRVAIVRALAMDPRVLLLDEITSALDPELVAEVLDIVRGLAHDGLTMLLATHEMSFAREVASTVCFLHAGTILEQGPPEQMFGDPQEERTKAFLHSVTAAGRL
ncbi:amino acid ABC transporter ATP-binding protein [Leekyejoonella antrihumi]|uniref:ABC-type polar-amino-acid transporter n=1 Tax=Leekyejoonella antrihumi TaxID=1660198 RepID=A0A563E850_9MICO|nr:amino acid ABC transporter ATP-binding protein [Leekyejoonella antrihumi]TWP38687.1 amino acid ABC transporter ATP-binding protein [Leekyejoonella antrihumi]